MMLESIVSYGSPVDATKRREIAIISAELSIMVQYYIPSNAKEKTINAYTATALQLAISFLLMVEAKY